MQLSSARQQGFTLIELLVALSISVLVILMTSLIFVSGVKHSRVIAGEAKLLGAASHMTDVLSYKIRPAIAISSPSSNQLEVVNGDLSTSLFEFTATTLELDGESVLPPAVVPSSGGFEIIDNTVRISYELTKDIGSDPNYTVNPLAITTTIAVRN